MRKGVIMTGGPWYLLAGGIGVFILGYFIASLSKRGSDQTFISPKMTDKEIARRMEKREGSRPGELVVLLGVAMIFVSVVWRIVRFFV